MLPQIADLLQSNNKESRALGLELARIHCAPFYGAFMDFLNGFSAIVANDFYTIYLSFSPGLNSFVVKQSALFKKKFGVCIRRVGRDFVVYDGMPIGASSYLHIGSFGSNAEPLLSFKMSLVFSAQIHRLNRAHKTKLVLEHIKEPLK